MKIKTFQVGIIGGGLAGLTAALHLSQNGVDVCLIEKKDYPRHKVCGEYVSNEVLPYLNTLGINPMSAGAKKITDFEITGINGKQIQATLPLGGFGMSRFALDFMLYQNVRNQIHVEIDRVVSVEKKGEFFIIQTQAGKKFRTSIVLGAFGKRSNMDSFLKRSFIQKKSPWVAVKNHYEHNFPDHLVSLHNFNGGYCGLSKTEENVVNACYLATFKSFKKAKNIDDFQKDTVSQNPVLNNFFREAKPVFKKPLAISQISFDKKQPVENHIFMTGDSAGLIHPLCGNGMAMAIIGAKLFSELYLQSLESGFSRNQLESDYTTQWNREFLSRLKTGRIIQKVLMNPIVSEIGLSVGKAFPALVTKIISGTHGQIG